MVRNNAVDAMGTGAGLFPIEIGYAGANLPSFRMTDAACAVKPLFPVAQLHAFDTHFAARGRRVDEFIVAHVNADMRKLAPERVVEHLIAGLQVVHLDMPADPADFIGC